MTIHAERHVWYASLAGNHIARIDVKTGNATVVEAADAQPGRPSGVVGFKGRIWISEWNSGNVSVHDPADGSWKAWKLPADSPRTYAVYVDEKDKVWLTDFGPTRSCVSIPSPKNSTRSRATWRAPMSGSSTAGPAKPGAANRHQPPGRIQTVAPA